MKKIIVKYLFKKKKKKIIVKYEICSSRDRAKDRHLCAWAVVFFSVFHLVLPLCLMKLQHFFLFFLHSFLLHIAWGWTRCYLWKRDSAYLLKLCDIQNTTYSSLIYIKVQWLWKLLFLVPNPYSFGPYEQRDKLIPKMEAIDLFAATNELLPYEHGRHARLTSQLLQHPFDLPSIGHLIKLINCRVCPKPTYEWPHRVAHTARALAEDHHWLVGHHPRHSIHWCEGKKELEMWACKEASSL